MSRNRVLRATAAVLLAMLFAWPALAQSHARAVRLSFLSGDVQMDRNLGGGLEKAILNTPITEGMKLQTGGGNNSLAEVEFEDGSTVRLTPDSSLEFSLLQLRESGAKATTVQVNDGVVYFNVVHKGNDEFGVRFADRSADLTKSAHFRVDVSPNDVQLAVFKGKVPVRAAASAVVEVKSNETLTLDGGSGRDELAKSIPSDRFDNWDNERVDYQKTYASGSSRFDLPYSYGASDLNYYGSWYSYPGYGYLWRPYGVGYGWDPFYNAGSWAWYPGFGYTFVSSYAWGWMPYRYGTWAFIPSFGWAWQPGGTTAWNPYPRVINPPRGWVPPRPPTTPPATVIVNNGGSGSPASGPLKPVPGGPSGAAATFGERTRPVPPALRTVVPVGPAPAGVVINGEPAARGNGRGPRAVDSEGIMRGPRPVPMGRRAPMEGATASPSIRTSTPPPAAPASRTSAPPPRVSSPPPHMSAPPRMSAPPMRTSTPHTSGSGRTPH